VADDFPEGAVCTNLSPGARRLRKTRAQILAGLALLWVVASIALGMEWWLRAVVFVPSVLAATNHLQARRSVCVLRALQGKVEHDDRSTETMIAEHLRATRWAAFRVVRDATLLALPVTIATALTAWL
jgi:hypothetical protein